MSVTASCGHVLTEEEDMGNSVSCGSYNREGERVIVHQVLCDFCLSELRQHGVELKTEAEQKNWLMSNRDSRRVAFMCSEAGLGTLFITYDENCAKEWVGINCKRQYHAILSVNKVEDIEIDGCEDYTLENTGR